MLRKLHTILNVLALSVIITLCPTTTAATYSFSPQGAAVLRSNAGHVIKGTQLLGVIICPQSPNETVLNGQVYQKAASLGYQYIVPVVGRVMVTQSVNRSLGHILLETLKEGAIDTAFGYTTGIIHIPASLATAGIASFRFLQKEQPVIEGVTANGIDLMGSLLNPDDATNLGSSCKSATMLALYDKKFKASVTPSIEVPPIVGASTVKDEEAFFDSGERLIKIKNANLAALAYVEQLRREREKQ